MEIGNIGGLLSEKTIFMQYFNLIQLYNEDYYYRKTIKGYI